MYDVFNWTKVNLTLPKYMLCTQKAPNRSYCFLIEVYLIYNIMLISGVQQSKSVTYVFFSGYFHHGLLENIRVNVETKFKF